LKWGEIMNLCPSPERLQDWLADQLAGPEVEAIAAHVEACADCRQTLEQLTGGPNRCQEVTVDAAGADFLRRLEQEPPAGPMPLPEGCARWPRTPTEHGTSTADPPTVPGYEVLGELGRGGMGIVFKARQESLDRLVALKVVLSGQFAGDQERVRFRTEALAVARLSHPNVVQVFEVGESQGHPYLALEYVAGGSLADQLHDGPLPPRPAAELVERLARAVQAAHDKGVVHRDLKPANVLLSTDGTPKIADFGLAKRLDAPIAATQSGAILGTPAYMAPEQAGGKTTEVGPGVDVWALGVLLYECLTGRVPFQGRTTTDTILRVLSDEPPPPRKLEPTVPRDLETIALKCLRKAPAQRYASAAELADDLRRFLHGDPIRARPLSLRERLWRRRRRLLAAGLALLLLALLGVAVQALLGWRQQLRDKAFDEAHARGLKQVEEGQPQQAVASFIEALRLRPNPSSLTERGTVYGTLGDTDRALADFAEALQLDRNNPLTYGPGFPTDDGPVLFFDFRKLLKTRFPYIMWMAQPIFLDFLATRPRNIPPSS
jgi:tetratricopeptide (TPR) repeat protein